MYNFAYRFSKYLTYYIRMATPASIERVKENAEMARKAITELKSELNILSGEYNNIRARQLREENVQLIQAVEEAKKKLIELEVKNGIKQILVPQIKTASVISETTRTNKQEPQKNLKTEQVIKAANTPDITVTDKQKDVKPVQDGDASKENKPKKEKKPKEKATPVTEPPVDVGRLDLRVAKIEDVQKHPDADTLYVLKINCGEEKPRTVCSGLVKHISMDELKNRMVMLLCNLKPVKMRGITSEAMVMCASSPEHVEVLIPPTDAVPGDLVECAGYARRPDAVMNPKKKIFETVAPDLHTNEDLQACYKGVPFSVPSKGTFVSRTLKHVQVK